MFNFCSTEYKKKVTFNNNLSLILIPNINDLIKFKNDLWWTKNEMDKMYTDFINEMNSIIKIYSIINKKEAFLISYYSIKND